MTPPLPIIEPLEPELWFAALLRLARRQRAAAAHEFESMLRHAFHLVQLTPGPLKGLVRCECQEQTFEKLLLLGAFETAAVALVAAPLSFEVRCIRGSGDDRVEASVSLPGREASPTKGTGNSFAGALVGAWSSCLVELRQRSHQEADHPARPAPRIKLAEPRRTSSEH